MRVAAASFTLAFAAVAIAQSTTIINVGEINGEPTFWFDPPHVKVTEVNSTVTFVFRKPGNHTVAQSSYAKPCEPLDGGFNSGFFFVDSSGTGTWNLTITDVSSPIWFYCAQQISEVHCELGMVGVINPPATGDTFDQFVYRADAATTVVYPSTALTGIGAFATAAAASTMIPTSASASSASKPPADIPESTKSTSLMSTASATSIALPDLNSTLVDVSTPSSTTSNVTSTSTSTPPAAAPFLTSGAKHTPAIVGGIVGASLLMILVAILAFLLQRRRRRNGSVDVITTEPYMPAARRTSALLASRPPSTTESIGRPSSPSSSAAGTVHTSAMSVASSVPHASPVVSEKSDQEGHPSPPPAGPHAAVASESHSLPSLPAATATATKTRTRSAVPSSATSSSSDAPLVLPTEIGRALAYAPPDVQSSVLSLFRSLFLRSGSPVPPGQRWRGEAGLRMPHAEVDSGLRMYDDDTYVPPPEYTTH